MLKWIVLVTGGLAAALGLVLAVVYHITDARFETSYTLPGRLTAVAEDSAAVLRGRHIATIRGCMDCHGANMGGRVFIDDPMLGRIAASNLTRGLGGVSGWYGPEDWDRAIRHGVRADGKPLLVMPSYEYNQLSDADVADLVAFIHATAPVDSELPDRRIGPLARALYLAGKLPLVSAEMIDHGRERPAPPAAGPTAAYGAYLSVSCTGCHGNNFAGARVPGSPSEVPPSANLTPDPETGLGRWTEADFFRAMREGKRPDGAALNDMMPWKAMTSHMTDDEIRALWQYFRTLPPLPAGGK